MRDHVFTLLPGPEAVAGAIARLAREDAASLPLLRPEARESLVAEGRALTFRAARPVVGEGAAAVFQDFELTTEFSPDSGFRALAGMVDDLLAAAFRRLGPPPLAGPFRINDLVLQRYPAGCRGITPHRDHLRYTGLVAVVVLAGRGRFGVCADRAGNGAREVPAPPGHLVLMRAPGLFGRRDRPFHRLTDITEERWSFGLRQNERAGS